MLYNFTMKRGRAMYVFTSPRARCIDRKQFDPIPHPPKRPVGPTHTAVWRVGMPRWDKRVYGQPAYPYRARAQWRIG